MSRSARPLRILWLEPHFGGSHRAILDGLVARSRHRIDLSTLPARNWKWRLRASGLAFACRHAADWRRYDLIVASSLVNLADVAASVKGRARLLLYMHESQLSYPAPVTHPSPTARAVSKGHRVTEASGTPARDWGLLFADLASAAAADRVLFNSRHHRRVFLRGARELLSAVPDTGVAGLAGAIARRSAVCPPGFEDADIPEPVSSVHAVRDPAPPLILWNHRWEFNKSPEVFFGVLSRLKARGLRFRLALLGESARVVPRPFLRAREQFGDRIARYGFVRRRSEYVRWLTKAAIAVSTARHENFGLAWLEATAAGAWPLLPRREAYPELLARSLHSRHLYDGPGDLEERLQFLLTHPDALERGRKQRSRAARRWNWDRRIVAFDRALGMLG